MLLAATQGCASKISTATIRPLESAQLAKWLNNPPKKGILLIDARKQEDFNESHISSARNLNLPDVNPARSNTRWIGYAAIVIYGQDPGSIRAEALTKRFMRLDAAPVYLLQGGFDEWQRKDMPTYNAANK